MPPGELGILPTDQTSNDEKKIAFTELFLAARYR